MNKKVKTEINNLVERLHTLCAENDIPMFLALVAEDANEYARMRISQVLSPDHTPLCFRALASFFDEEGPLDPNYLVLAAETFTAVMVLRDYLHQNNGLVN